MAEASTMFLTMKRLMALSFGTITPEASQRTRRTCKPAKNVILQQCAAAKASGLIACLPGPCHACCVLLQGKTSIKVRTPPSSRLLPSSASPSNSAPDVKVLTVPAANQKHSKRQLMNRQQWKCWLGTVGSAHTCASSSSLLSRGRRGRCRRQKGLF